MDSSDKRLSLKVPTELTVIIRQIAAQDGVEPAYWARKILEQAIQQRFAQSA